MVPIVSMVLCHKTNEKNYKAIFGGDEYAYYLDVIMVSWIYAYVQTH